MSFFKAHYTYNPNGDKYKFDQLLFVRDSEFLRCYCAEFVKGKMAPECNTNARLLVEYFNVHGKLLDLMKEVAKREIETTNAETQVFRGNTSFTRLYGEYCHLCLLPYLRAVTKEILNLNPDALNSPELENHKESMDTFCKLAHMFGTKLVDCVHLLPSHFHSITSLTAFSKTCQSLLNETTTSSSIPLDIANFMTSSASKLFEMFTHPRSGYMTEKSGLDFSLQANAHKNIVELVRSNIEPLTAFND
ncbi:hypothetical protein ENUP19_0325G0020 [Entamoeba nuttalli]|uniref:Ras-GAP domain-containing protein n=1 Tax=Entamoeba nuttalli TaxID=412467 RepID=A0ABQ0DWE5_9EUKA